MRFLIDMMAKMECLRCKQKDFTVSIYSFFGYAVVQCDGCSQQFHVKEKMKLHPIEVIGLPSEIEQECIIKKCNVCDTQRFIAEDCTTLNMFSCSLCGVTSEPVGEKIPLEDFLNRA